ncbi:hypothetical protein HN378_05455 [Candidatus Peregrinibacteria bacterium]|nr:hypothetical protein [Candidatus Peregrinibacteria bacterium]
MNCPHCNKTIVTPSGYRESKILIIRDEPYKTEYSDYKRPRFQPHSTPKSILRDEMFRLGVDFNRVRFANLWKHIPNKKEECFQEMKKSLFSETRGKKAILLAGADVVKFFTGYNVSEISGLQVESNKLSASIIFASVDSTTAMSRGMGEIRFSIENFVKKLIEEDVL